MVIYTFSKAVDRVEVMSLFHVFNEEKAYFCNQDRSFEVFLAGKLQEVSGSIQELRAKSKEVFSEVIYFKESISPVLLGGISFDSKSDEVWKDGNTSSFYLYVIQISKKESKWFLSINRVVANDENPNLNALNDELMSIWKGVKRRLTKIVVKQGQKSGGKVEKRQSTSEKESWKNDVKQILRQINEKNVLKVVLSRKLEVSLSNHSILRTFGKIRESNQNTFVFYIETKNRTCFVGASPELLIGKVKNKIKTMALAGSMPKAESPEKDIVNQRLLLESEKNLDEHKVVVDMMRDTLLSCTKNLRVEENPRLLNLGYIHHLKTEITAEVNSGIDIFTLLEKLHPTPALGGMPRKKALKLISKLEEHARGWYGSPIGYIDSDLNGEFTVAIRSAVLEDNKAHIYAGAGIVQGSDPEEEWNETEKKFQPILNALI